MSDQAPIVACRTSSYEPFEAGALAHIASLGLRHVEIALPGADEVEATSQGLEENKLSAISLHGECDVQCEDIAKRVTAQMPAFAALGCNLMFTSVQRGEMPAEQAYERLRQAGDAAQAAGVTIALETHPDLISNADVALATMQGVNHPNVRINFDTANLYFYNHEIDCVEQLRRMLPYVASVHLKDTDGGYRHWHFPALGEGIIDFPAVFALLDESGFTGPCTLEIEGIEGEEKSEGLTQKRIADSVEYLRKLGRV